MDAARRGDHALTRNQVVVFAAAAALVVATSLTWFEAEPTSVELQAAYPVVFRRIGWELPLWSVLPTILAIVTFTASRLRRLRADLAIRWPLARIQVATASAALALVVTKLIVGESASAFTDLVEVEVRRSAGVWIATAATIALAAGAALDYSGADHSESSGSGSGSTGSG